MHRSCGGALFTLYQVTRRSPVILTFVATAALRTEEQGSNPIIHDSGAFMFKFRLYFAAVVILCGCQQQPGRIAWVDHSLSPQDEARQETLLDKIAVPLYNLSNKLDGTAAAPYTELLSLADRSGVRGNETHYSFNVMSQGEATQCSMTIIVEDGKIKFARWPYAEF